MLQILDELLLEMGQGDVEQKLRPALAGVLWGYF